MEKTDNKGTQSTANVFSREYQKEVIETIINGGNVTWQEKKDRLADASEMLMVHTIYQMMYLLRTGKITREMPNAQVVELIKAGANE